MADRPLSLVVSGPAASGSRVLELLSDPNPPVHPPAYQEVAGGGGNNNDSEPTYPPPQVSDPNNHELQEQLPSYNDSQQSAFDGSVAFLLFSGIPPFAYEYFLNNGIRGSFRLTGARILNLVGWTVGIITATLGLKNQAIPSSTLAVFLVVLCAGLYILEKYREDCQQFAPSLFERDYKIEIAHGGFWLIHLLISWYPLLMAMRHAGEVYVSTRSSKKGVEDLIAVVLINLGIFASLLLLAYLGRWIMTKLQLPARLRQLGERRPTHLLVVEEAIILTPRLIICVCFYGTMQLTVSSLRMDQHLWALESREAAQHTALFVTYAFFTFAGYHILRRLATHMAPALNRFLFE